MKLISDTSSEFWVESRRETTGRHDYRSLCTPRRVYKIWVMPMSVDDHPASIILKNFEHLGSSIKSAVITDVDCIVSIRVMMREKHFSRIVCATNKLLELFQSVRANETPLRQFLIVMACGRIENDNVQLRR
ncbi:hypothetical protein ASE64_06225 [Agreia sp. Leaf210]|nr:hypothetical protein ASE64_06225 [Agreia sp. Leaf210]